MDLHSKTFTVPCENSKTVSFDFSIIKNIFNNKEYFQLYLSLLEN